MSDQDGQLVPVPAGATIGNGNANGISPGAKPGGNNLVPVPQGATVGTPPPTTGDQPSGDQNGGSWADSIAGAAVGVGKGFLKGAEDTSAGIGSMIHRTGEFISPGLGESIVPKVGLDSMKDQAKVHGTAEAVGYGGETLMEFILGDEALKGLSVADKILQAGKVAKILQGSPKIMKALQLGADVSKAKGMLTPAARAAVEESPILSRLVSAGMDAIRAGAVQTGQTAARTGGDLGQSVKEGAAMTATVGVLGGVLGAGAGALTKAAGAANKMEGLATRGIAAADKEAVAGKVGQKIDAAEKTLHDTYERGIQGLSDRLGEGNISAQENPLAQKAQQLLDEPVPGEHKLVTKATDTARAGLRDDVRGLMEEIASGHYKEAAKEGEATSGLVDQFGKPVQAAEQSGETLVPHEPYKITDLIGRPKNMGETNQPSVPGLRQRIRELAEQFQPGDVNSRTLKRLLFDPVDHASAMDDTIESLARQAGDPQAVGDYRDLRKLYRDKINAFNDPVIQKLRNGKIDDAAKDFIQLQKKGSVLPSAGGKRYNLEQLQTVLGDQGVREFGHDVFHTMLKDATTDTQGFNGEKFLESWARIAPETKDGLFDLNAAHNGLNQLLNDAKSARNLQRFTKMGMISAIGGGVGFAHGGLGFASLLGLMAAERGIPFGRQALDWFATHPKVMAGYQWGGRAVADKTAQGVAGVAKLAGAKALKSEVFGGADSLK